MEEDDSMQDHTKNFKSFLIIFNINCYEVSYEEIWDKKLQKIINIGKYVNCNVLT
jgi:hypothetical protein